MVQLFPVLVAVSSIAATLAAPPKASEKAMIREVDKIYPRVEFQCLCKDVYTHQLGKGPYNYPDYENDVTKRACGALRDFRGKGVFRITTFHGFSKDYSRHLSSDAFSSDSSSSDSESDFSSSDSDSEFKIKKRGTTRKSDRLVCAFWRAKGTTEDPFFSLHTRLCKDIDPKCDQIRFWHMSKTGRSTFAGQSTWEHKEMSKENGAAFSTLEEEP